MWIKRLLIGCISSIIALSAFAFDRPFPVNVQRGTFSPVDISSVIIDGNIRRLSASARIWNQENLTEVPTSLRGSDFPVLYVETETGEIEKIWLLTAKEAAEYSPTLRAMPVRPILK